VGDPRALSDTLFWAADAYLLWCFERQTSPRVAELAQRSGISRHALRRAWIERTGSAPAAYLKRRQIEFSKILLEVSDLGANAVAYRAGFGTRRTLFRSFRRVATTTPTEHREARKKSLA